MDALSLIRTLAAKGVTLIPDGDVLVARPRERLTDTDREAIRQLKVDLIAHLYAQRSAALDSRPLEASIGSGTENLNRPACPACHSTDLRVSSAGGLVCRGCGRFLFLHVEAGASVYPMAPVRACGALVCPDCRIHSPSPHRGTCRAPRVKPCGSRWFWLSPYRAIKCVACEGPTNLSLVEGWVMVRESEVPEEIFKLLHVEAPAQ